MLSATLQEGLEEYAIGEKIRTLRLKKKMGLVELMSKKSLLIRNSPRRRRERGEGEKNRSLFSSPRSP